MIEKTFWHTQCVYNLRYYKEGNSEYLTGLTVTSKPFEFDLELETSKNIHSFTLVAHNLGSIPPNTATVIIDIGIEKYRLSARSDLSRNAVILIKEK